MFTGIVEEVGEVLRVERGRGLRLAVGCRAVSAGLRPGDSVAVDGACLTVEAHTPSSFTCFVSTETVARTTLGSARPGGRVNLERALALGDRIGGHLVSGHVEAVGILEGLRPEGESWLLEVGFPPPFSPFVLEKGSVAVDGVSLTVAGASPGRFRVALVPETVEKTTFCLKRPGDSVNLEPDLILKYVRSAVEGILRPGAAGGLTLERLRAAGFDTGGLRTGEE